MRPFSIRRARVSPRGRPHVCNRRYAREIRTSAPARRVPSPSRASDSPLGRHSLPVLAQRAC